MHEGPAVREQLHQREREVQAAAGVRVLSVKRWWLAAVLSSMAVLPAAAQNMSYGNGFYAYCQDAREWAQLTCVAYVKGLHDMAGFLWSSGRIRPEVCPPDGVVIAQYYDILSKFLRDNPDQRQKPTAALLWEAASKAYPCPRR
jgi:hypothetical protein